MARQVAVINRALDKATADCTGGVARVEGTRVGQVGVLTSQEVDESEWVRLDGVLGAVRETCFRWMKEEVT